MENDPPVAASGTASIYPPNIVMGIQNASPTAPGIGLPAKWLEPPTASDTVNLLVGDTHPDAPVLFLQALKAEPRVVLNAVRKLDWRDRVTATSRLQAIAGSETELLLRALLTSDRSKHVREAAVQAIERSGLNSRMRDFAIALHDRHIDVRREAGMSFFRQNDARSVSPLAEAVGSTTRERSEEAVEALKEMGRTDALPQLVLASCDMDPAEKLKAFEILRRQQRRLRRAGIPCSIQSVNRILADASRSNDPDVRAGAEGITAYLTLPRASDPRSAAPPGQLLRAVRRNNRIPDPSKNKAPEPDVRAPRFAWWDIRRWFGPRR